MHLFSVLAPHHYCFVAFNASEYDSWVLDGLKKKYKHTDEYVSYLEKQRKREKKKIKIKGFILTCYIRLCVDPL